METKESAQRQIELFALEKKLMGTLIDKAQSNLETLQQMHKNISTLQEQTQENTVRLIAVMELLHAVVYCARNRNQIVSRVENIADLTLAHPKSLLDNREMFLRMRAYLDEMTGLHPPSAHE